MAPYIPLIDEKFGDYNQSVAGLLLKDATGTTTGLYTPSQWRSLVANISATGGAFGNVFMETSNDGLVWFTQCCFEFIMDGVQQFIIEGIHFKFLRARLVSVAGTFSISVFGS